MGRNNRAFFVGFLGLHEISGLEPIVRCEGTRCVTEIGDSGQVSYLIEGTTPEMLAHLRAHEDIDAVYTGPVPNEDIETFDPDVAAYAHLFNRGFTRPEETPLDDSGQPLVGRLFSKREIDRY